MRVNLGKGGDLMLMKMLLLGGGVDEFSQQNPGSRISVSVDK